MKGDFNFLDNFRFFDKKVKQFLKKADLSATLEDLGIQLSNKQLNLLFSVCDRDKKGFLRCSDLSILFMTYDDKYRQLVENRQPYFSAEMETEFSRTILQGIKKVVLGWLEVLEQA